MMIQAIINLGWDKPVSVSEDGVIDWYGAQGLPQADIDAEVARLEQDKADNLYAVKRLAEYKKLNQFEMQFDDHINGSSTWVDAINAIKARFPKP
jgi:hypothetical protein